MTRERPAQTPRNWKGDCSLHTGNVIWLSTKFLGEHIFSLLLCIHCCFIFKHLLMQKKARVCPGLCSFMNNLSYFLHFFLTKCLQFFVSKKLLYVLAKCQISLFYILVSLSDQEYLFCFVFNDCLCSCPAFFPQSWYEASILLEANLSLSPSHLSILPLCTFLL